LREFFAPPIFAREYAADLREARRFAINCTDRAARHAISRVRCPCVLGSRPIQRAPMASVVKFLQPWQLHPVVDLFTIGLLIVAVLIDPVPRAHQTHIWLRSTALTL